MDFTKNKIEASHTSIKALLKEQKFYIDYFQREYRWEEKHIKTLIEDLTATFLKSYKLEDGRASVAKYQNYYLGPMVFNVNEGEKSIIDGQQRITSITLFLIYLNHLQKEHKDKVSISELIFSEKYGNKSFNITDIGREPCLRSLFEKGEYTAEASDDETIKNMADRYSDIFDSFPEELAKEALPYFIDWLIENVVIVEITAYSNENAYTIFETMNDRGLNLTPTEMLKGYVLSQITDINQRSEINEIWKTEIQKLHEYGERAGQDTDQDFFQAWFRGKYAVSIRPGQAGAKNQDFELIGSQFHSWFRDNHEKLFKLKTSNDFYNYFKKQFPFYVEWYLKSWDAHANYDKKMPHMHYINHSGGMATSLKDPLLLSSINFKDDEDTIRKKLDFTARYIETFTVKRAVNFKKFGQTSIRYTMFNVIKKIRNNSIDKLASNLINEVDNMGLEWDAVSNFGLHGQNRRFVKHLLSRISSYTDCIAERSTDYDTYYGPAQGKKFEIEHIWGNKFSMYKDEFKQEADFQEHRNLIGALILLQSGTNQSFSNKKYEDKLKHYIKENAYAQTLHPDFYQNNPNFLKSSSRLGFKPHPEFKKQDIEERGKLVQKICEQLWATSYYSKK